MGERFNVKLLVLSPPVLKDMCTACPARSNQVAHRSLSAWVFHWRRRGDQTPGKQQDSVSTTLCRITREERK
mgnify:FL=1